MSSSPTQLPFERPSLEPPSEDAATIGTRNYRVLERIAHLPGTSVRVRREIDVQGALLVFGATALVCTALVQAGTWSLSARFEFRTIVLAGAACFAVAGAWPLAFAESTPNYATGALPGLIAWGVANALLQPTLFATADAAPGAELSSASAVPTSARQVGSALGVALFVAVRENQRAPGLALLRRAWGIVLVVAVFTAIAGLRARKPSPAEDGGGRDTVEECGCRRPSPPPFSWPWR